MRFPYIPAYVSPSPRLSVWTSRTVSGLLLLRDTLTLDSLRHSLPPSLSSGVRRLQWALPHRGQREGRVRGVRRQLGHKPAHLHDLPHNHRCVIDTNCRSALHLSKLLTDEVMRRCNTVDTRQIGGPACRRTSAEQSHESKPEKWCTFSSLFAVTWQI